ncbi:MAG: T9SS type A sorting domain-containing protein [Candidatus Kapabacteria bacterium]|nr:T9SS type A sorting domain-containing protein [Candidatus Kapabacteria bacterium]
MKRIFLCILILMALAPSLNSQEIIQRNIYDYAPDERLWDNSYVLDYIDGNKLFIYTTVKPNEPNRLKIILINTLGDTIKSLNSDKNIRIFDVFIEKDGKIKILGNFSVRDDFGLISHISPTYLELDKELNIINEATSALIQSFTYIPYFFSNDGNEIFNPEYIQSEDNLYMNRYYVNLELKERKKINLTPLKIPNTITSVRMERYNSGHYVIINEQTGGFPHRYNKINLLKIDEILTPKSLIKYGDSLYTAFFINSNPNGEFLIRYNEVNLNIYKKTFLNAYDNNLKLKYTSDTLNPTSDSPDNSIFKTAHILNEASTVMLHEKRPDYEQLVRKYDNSGKAEYEFTLMSFVGDTASLDFTKFHDSNDNLVYLSAQYGYQGYNWDSEKYPGAHFKTALYVIGDPASVEDNRDFTHNFHIYPNPSRDLINLGALNECHPINKQIDIYNLLGEKVLSILNNENPFLTVDISNLGIGTYFVRCGTCTGYFFIFE